MTFWSKLFGTRSEPNPEKHTHGFEEFQQLPDSDFDLEAEFRRFIGAPRGISLQITERKEVQEGRAMLALRPTPTPPDPGALVSYIKAKLLCEMPTAIDGVALELKRKGSFVNIDCGGHSFREPGWFVQLRGMELLGSFGPLSFRQGSWDSNTGEYLFWLTQVHNPPHTANELRTLTNVLGLATNQYRREVRTIAI